MPAFQSPNLSYTIDLPAPDGGKVYRIASPDYHAGKALLDYQQRTALTAASMAVADHLDDTAISRLIDSLTIDDEEEADLYRLALGETLDEMLADKVPFQFVTLCAGTVVRWVNGDVDDARRYFESGGQRPKAVKTPQDHLPPSR